MIGKIVPDWPAPARVRAFSTTREGGFSLPPFDSLNLGTASGDDPAAVERNRAAFAEHLPAQPGWLQQVHGAEVLQRETLDEALPPQADATWCQTPRLPCTVLTADCLPVLLCDLEGTRVAAAHAGWRGLAAGVLQATVAAMDAEPARLLAWLGPGIGSQAYGVDELFRDRFLRLDPQLNNAFGRHDGQWRADLCAIARHMLAGCGVSRVFGGDHCTYTEARQFFSYRRDGACGRMATTIWLD